MKFRKGTRMSLLVKLVTLSAVFSGGTVALRH